MMVVLVTYPTYSSPINIHLLGVVELRNLDLNIDLLNDMLEGLPLTILSGSIRYVRATIPWRNIMSGGTQHCQLHVEGLHIVVVPSEQVERKGNDNNNS